MPHRSPRDLVSSNYSAIRSPLAFTAALFLMAVAPTPAAAQASAPSSGSVLDAQEEVKIAKTLAQSGVPSVSIAIVEDGKTVYLRAFGDASRSPEVPATEKTRYAVGSISKQFTSAIILLLQEEGKLSLDDPVSNYFPDLTRANEISIRQLLSHTSGYEDYAPQDYMIPAWTQPTTPQAILDQWAKKPLNFDPGTKWQYSNTNYVLAGRIAEMASGETLMQLLHEKIFTPLEMSSAGDCSVDKTPEDAVAYTRYGLGPARPALREGPGWYFAAGELCMTPADLSKWNIAFLEKRILKPSSYDEFTREVLLKNGNYTHYSLGFRLADIDNIPALNHGGEVSGFLATNWVFPTRNSAVTILSNQDDMDLIFSMAEDIARYVLEPESRKAPEDGSPEELQQVRSILEGLQHGKIDRSLLTSDLNFYFNDVALHDMQSSLSPLGAVKSVKRTREVLRGGMTFRVYHIEFEKKSLLVTVYLMPDGHFEQFLPIEQF